VAAEGDRIMAEYRAKHVAHATPSYRAYAALAACIAGGMLLGGCGKGSFSVKFDLSSPRSLVETVDRAFQAKDFRALAACYAPEQRKTNATIWRNQERYWDCARDTAGVIEGQISKQEAAEFLRVAEAQVVSPLQPATRNGRVDWSLVKIVQESPDRATIVVPGGGHPELKRIDGQWYFFDGQSEPTRWSRFWSEQLDRAVRARYSEKIEYLHAISSRVEQGTINTGNFHKWLAEEATPRLKWKPVDLLGRPEDGAP